MRNKCLLFMCALFVAASQALFHLDEARTFECRNGVDHLFELLAEPMLAEVARHNGTQAQCVTYILTPRDYALGRMIAQDCGWRVFGPHYWDCLKRMDRFKHIHPGDIIYDHDVPWNGHCRNSVMTLEVCW